MIFKEKQTVLLRDNQRMTLKPEMIFWSISGITFSVITSNQELISTSQKKALLQFRSSRVFLFAPETIKQSDSPCLSAQCVVCVRSLIPLSVHYMHRTVLLAPSVRVLRTVSVTD